MTKAKRQSRREALQTLGKGSAAAVVFNSLMQSCASDTTDTRGGGRGGSNSLNLATGLKGDEKFLIVLTCFGGASILDSFLAMRESDVTGAGGTSANLNCFPDSQVSTFDGSPLRAAKVDATIGPLGNFKISTDQTDFVRKHMQDIMVVSTEVTSVNHAVAQKRAITGNDAWKGRTMQELVAERYGKGLPLANLAMASGGFSAPGIDETLPDHARQMFVVDPLHFSLGLHSTAGLPEVPSDALLEVARKVRSQKLERRGMFLKAFGGAPSVKRWLNFRETRMPDLEQRRLIDSLFMLNESAPGIAPDPEMQVLRDAFPNFMKDNLHAQAIIAYLSITRGISCTVSLGPDSSAAGNGISDFYNTPIAFDFSHSDHRGTQAMMWNRVMGVADKLIDLLKKREFAGGESFWDRSAIYFASDFGRDKVRPAGSTSFSTGHHLNNASVIVSPLAKGNTVLGGLDYKTGLTHGFNLATGESLPSAKVSERELFAGVMGMMGLDVTTAGLPDVRAMRKNS